MSEGIDVDHPAREARSRCFVCGVTQRHEGLCTTRQEVVISDDGSGEAERVAARLFVDQAEADRLAPVGRADVVLLGPRHMELHETDDPDEVELVDLSMTPESRRVKVERGWLVDRLLKRATHGRLAEESEAPLLHGGAVADDDGAALVVLGPSGSGKSTLIAHLVAGGMSLLNDEQLTVHTTAGLVGGFTRPIDCKPGGLRHLPDPLRNDLVETETGVQVSARDLGGRHALVGRPAMVLLPERDASTEGVEWERLNAAEGFEALCANNLDLARAPRRAVDAFAWLAATVPTVRVRYSEAGAAAAAMIEALGEPPHVDPVAYQVTDAVADGNVTAASGWRPVGCALSVELGDRCVLYHLETRAVVRLNPAGSAVWREVLAGRAVPDGGHELLDRLAELGLVTRR